MAHNLLIMLGYLGRPVAIGAATWPVPYRSAKAEALASGGARHAAVRQSGGGPEGGRLGYPRGSTRTESGERNKRLSEGEH